jgi:hypothetical protein
MYLAHLTVMPAAIFVQEAAASHIPITTLHSIPVVLHDPVFHAEHAGAVGVQVEHPVHAEG